MSQSWSPLRPTLTDPRRSKDITSYAEWTLQITLASKCTLNPIYLAGYLCLWKKKDSWSKKIRKAKGWGSKRASLVPHVICVKESDSGVQSHARKVINGMNHDHRGRKESEGHWSDDLKEIKMDFAVAVEQFGSLAFVRSKEVGLLAIKNGLADWLTGWVALPT